MGNDTQARDACAEVIRNFLLAGGRMIDSSPMYGSSQAVIGYGLNKLGQSKNVFSADKVWIADGAAGPAQIEASRRDWGVPRFDLLQVHNLLSWEAHLPMLFAMKAAGRLRYVGITTSHGRRHRELEQIMASQPIDFVQLTYNLVDREASIGTIRRSGIRGGTILRYEVCPYLCTDPATILNFKAAALIQTLTCKTDRTSQNAHLHPDHL